MKAMILAAGLGTRLRPLTDHCPKPLLPLMLQPMLAHLLRQLQRYEVRDVIINLHHHATQLATWLGDGSRWGLHLSLSFEQEILGPAGALKRVEPWLRDGPFFVINADELVDLDLQAVWHWHAARPDALVTMVVRPDPAARAYGAVVVDTADRVVHINGRPSGRAAAAGQETIFTGIQIVAPPVLDWIPPARFVSTTAEVYPALIEHHQGVYGYRYTGYWLDVGVPERYLQAHWDMLDGRLGDEWESYLPPGSQVVRYPDSGLTHAEGATIMPPVVFGPGVTVAPRAQIGPYTVLGTGCHVAAGALVQASVLGERVQVGAGTHVRHCILGVDVCLPATSRLSKIIRSQ